MEVEERFSGPSYYATSCRTGVVTIAFLPKITSSCQRSCHPMMRRKFISVARNHAATQRCTIAASRQRHTRRVPVRTPDCGLSITFVVARQRCRDDGIPQRLSVKHSSSPSRRLLAAAGDSCSSQSASAVRFHNRVPDKIPVYKTSRSAPEMQWPRLLTYMKERVDKELLVHNEYLAPEYDYCSFAYSALACLKIGMSGSASFQRLKKSW